MRMVSWNIASSDQCWQHLERNADDFDLALLQEASTPPASVSTRVFPRPGGSWATGGRGRRPFRTAVAALSDRVAVDPIPSASLETAGSRELPISRTGTITAVEVDVGDGDPVQVVSAYAVWEETLIARREGWIYSDASTHRLISDLSALVAAERDHRIVVAGDLNALHGYGEDGSPYWKRRYDTIFDRMDAIGIPFVGPQAPSGQQADPWPSELPDGSRNVPTYRTRRDDPASATRQLDFVFASRDLGDRVAVRALNEPDEWGPSDHCRLEITLD